MSTVFTFPGRAGDALLQFPVAYQWSKATGDKFTCWLDERSCKMVAPLFAAQTCVEAVEFKPGIEGYPCGGQPFHFDLPTSEFKDRTIFHMGFRSFPQRQITLETLENAKLPVKIDRQDLAHESCFMFHVEPKNRLILHGNPVCPHTKTTPGFWKFLASITSEISELFDEIVWVGDKRDREIGTRTYPQWKDFDDGGSFLEVAKLMAGSKAVIACGSSMAALGQVLKVPTIRVHDPIGNHPRVIWSGLGESQLNLTEIELREAWPQWRDRWIKQEVPK